MFELLKAGGFLIWPILLCSVVALAIVIERFSSLRTSTVAPPELTERVGKLLKKGSIDSKTINELEEHSPLGRVLAAGLKNPNQHRVVVKEAVEEAALQIGVRVVEQPRDPGPDVVERDDPVVDAQHE